MPGRLFLYFIYVKINLIDGDVKTTRQTSMLHRTTRSRTMATKAKSTKTNNNRSSKATTTVSTSSPDHEKVANESKLPATSGSSTEFATSIERHVNTTQKFNAKTNDTKVLKHTFRTTHNQMHKTIGKCNCSAFYNPFGASKTVTGDTISTLKNIYISTHVIHINKTYMKNDSKIDKRKQKSQG